MLCNRVNTIRAKYLQGSYPLGPCAKVAHLWLLLLLCSCCCCILRADMFAYPCCSFCWVLLYCCCTHIPRICVYVPRRTTTYSLCIEKKQPFCHYQLKPPTKPRSAKAGAARRRSSSSSSASSASSGGFTTGAAKRAAGTATADAAVHGGSGGDVQAVPGTWSVAMVPSSMSLKRLVLEVYNIRV